jgi:hypothetical protein
VQDIDDTELQDPIDPELISNPPLRPDPDRDSFQTILQGEFALARGTSPQHSNFTAFFECIQIF